MKKHTANWLFAGVIAALGITILCIPYNRKPDTTAKPSIAVDTQNYRQLPPFLANTTVSPESDITIDDTIMLLTRPSLDRPIISSVDQGIAANTQFLQNLIDAYNAYAVLHRADFVIQQILRHECLTSDFVRNTKQKIRIGRIFDHQIRKTIQNYRDHFIAILQNQSHADTLSNESIEDLVNESFKVDSTLVAKYSPMIPISKPRYAQIRNPAQYVHKMDYDSLRNVTYWNPVQALRSIVNVLQSADKSSYEEETIWRVEYANIHRHFNLYHITPSALDQLSIIMANNQYSFVLYEAWRKWRCLQQHEIGLSKDSDIPNEFYNQIRLRLANTTLKHLVRHPQDTLALDVFFCLSECPDLEIFAPGPWNKAGYEHILLFSHIDYGDQDSKDD